MKLNEIQLSCFETILHANGYKTEFTSYRKDFSYYKTIIKEEDFELYIHLEFYDFREYKHYDPKEFPFSFEPKIVISQEAFSTSLYIPFLFREKPLFTYYNDKEKCFVEKEWTEEEVEEYLRVLEEIACGFKRFYAHSIEDYIIE